MRARGSDQQLWTHLQRLLHRVRLVRPVRPRPPFPVQWDSHNKRPPAHPAPAYLLVCLTTARSLFHYLIILSFISPRSLHRRINRPKLFAYTPRPLRLNEFSHPNALECYSLFFFFVRVVLFHVLLSCSTNMCDQSPNFLVFVSLLVCSSESRSVPFFSAVPAIEAFCPLFLNSVHSLHRLISHITSLCFFVNNFVLPHPFMLPRPDSCTDFSTINIQSYNLQTHFTVLKSMRVVMIL